MTDTEITEYDPVTDDTLRDILAAATGGPWYLPHFADPSIKCGCHYVFGDGQGYMGCVTTVEEDNGLPISEGGNDSAPHDEAVANAKAIVAGMRLCMMVVDPTTVDRLLPALDPSQSPEETIRAILDRLAFLSVRP